MHLELPFCYKVTAILPGLPKQEDGVAPIRLASLEPLFSEASGVSVMDVEKLIDKAFVVVPDLVPSFAGPPALYLPTPLAGALSSSAASLASSGSKASAASSSASKSTFASSALSASTSTFASSTSSASTSTFASSASSAMASSPTGAVYDPTPGTGKNRVILRSLLATFLAHFDEVVAKYGRAFFPVKRLTSALAAVDKKKYEEGDAAFVQLSAWSKLTKSKFDHDILHITCPSREHLGAIKGLSCAVEAVSKRVLAVEGSLAGVPALTTGQAIVSERLDSVTSSVVRIERKLDDIRDALKELRAFSPRRQAGGAGGGPHFPEDEESVSSAAAAANDPLTHPPMAGASSAALNTPASLASAFAVTSNATSAMRRHDNSSVLDVRMEDSIITSFAAVLISNISDSQRTKTSVTSGQDW